VKPDTLDASYSQERETVLVFQLKISGPASPLLARDAKTTIRTPFV
jgi:hypothetical protein